MSESQAASGLRGLVAGPVVALELLTALRLRLAPIQAERALGLSQAWFPAVGLLLGAILLGLDEGLDGYLPAGVRAWLLVATLAALSGGLHVDGLADTADGVFGARTREERLSIMRDGSIGAFGAAAVVIVLALKATTIASLSATRPEALLLAPALGRWAIVCAIAAFPYARAEGLGKPFHASALPWAGSIATATAVAATVALLGSKGLVLVAIGGGLALGLGYLISGRLGGLTGDTYGAINEAGEVLVLLAILALETRGWF
ncbi:MAG TPA: adenosylcobinamide-GDP ribazoletransferase [Dehalococcoidia bacterium]